MSPQGAVLLPCWLVPQQPVPTPKQLEAKGQQEPNSEHPSVALGGSCGHRSSLPGFDPKKAADEPQSHETQATCPQAPIGN